MLMMASYKGQQKARAGLRSIVSGFIQDSSKERFQSVSANKERKRVLLLLKERNRYFVHFPDASVLFVTRSYNVVVVINASEKQ